MINVFALDKKSSVRCECLVVGSGAGGALSAAYLAKQGKDVVILEEGPLIRTMPDITGITSVMPVMWREGGIIPVWGNTNLVFAEGRCVGGSTMINAGLINRLSEETVSSWAEHFHIADFTSSKIDRYQADIERRLNAHILSGRENPAGRLFKEGAAKSHFRGAEVPIAVSADGQGLKKSNMVETYLQDAADAGARVITDCKVEKILFRGNKAYGVRVSCRDPAQSAFRLDISFDHLFVCGGALQTPLLLRRSGITRNIGNTLQFHPTLRVAAEFPEPMRAYATPMSGFQIKEFAPDISMGVSLPLPPFLVAALGSGEKSRGYATHVDRMALYYVMIRPQSFAKIRNVPLGRDGYMITQKLKNADIRNLSFGFGKLCRLLFEAGATRLFPAIEGSGAMGRDAKCERFLTENLSPRKLNLVSIHAFSSCPMGERDDLCAVDSYGKLRGFDNVYVNDASILPSAPGVNPQGPLMAIALRNLEKNFG